jgi:hypothetical protein
MPALDVITRQHTKDLKIIAELEELGDGIQRSWPTLPDPLLLEWSESPIVAIDRSGTPWIVGPVERDPLRGSDGGTVVPRKQLARLQEIAELDVPFQRLAIAHELDPEDPVKSVLPALREGPRPCADEVARALVGEVPAHPGVTRAVRALDSAVGGATSAVPSHLWATLLDPIIFGIIAPALPWHGQLCLWYPLVAWRW